MEIGLSRRFTTVHTSICSVPGTIAGVRIVAAPAGIAAGAFHDL